MTALATTNEVWWIDSRVTVTLAAEPIGTWIWDARRGAAAPMHVHEREDEQFLVLDGEVGFVIGDARVIARAGQSVFLPRGVPHGYVVLSESARTVGSATPGGFEAFFTDLGTPVVDGEPAAPGPTIPELAAAGPRFGIQIVGPPPVFAPA
jgi:quercetin dioxygenase-like cupin family protein